MKEIEFRDWLLNQGVSKKMQSDFVSRLKRLETNLDFFDIDEEVKFDNCNRLLNYLSSGCKESPYSKKLELAGSSKQYTVLKYAVKKYLSFLQDFN
ncbi:MAG: hypothetical protein SOU88_08315 [Candidatus Treponema excrementipullorum]|nr:hypothetical protein [Spirochaetia bacterium]MCI7588279.1 hypothetical protein [Spirochaetia bacterium]MDY2756414.1 hypothetical protein [Candidatus Treponema excrementipullorum]